MILEKVCFKLIMKLSFGERWRQRGCTVFQEVRCSSVSIGFHGGWQIIQEGRDCLLEREVVNFMGRCV